MGAELLNLHWHGHGRAMCSRSSFIDMIWCLVCKSTMPAMLCPALSALLMRTAVMALPVAAPVHGLLGQGIGGGIGLARHRVRRQRCCQLGQLHVSLPARLVLASLGSPSALDTSVGDVSTTAVQYARRNVASQLRQQRRTMHGHQSRAGPKPRLARDIAIVGVGFTNTKSGQTPDRRQHGVLLPEGPVRGGRRQRLRVA